MIVFRYDNTLEGLLTALFDAFELKIEPDHIIAKNDSLPLLATDIYNIETNINKFNRVSTAMNKRLPKIVMNQLTYVWLSELPERGLLIFRYLYKVFKTKQDITTNFSDPDILAIQKLAKKVSHERHYLMMFVRFNAINNNGEKTYFAIVEPRYNALPLTLDFFQDRFADQKWAIYDEKRQYGYYYDLKQVELINLGEDNDLIVDGKINQSYMSKDELQFQKMWQHYCQAITIEERINHKLQRQFMPTRFWKHLTEKQ